MKNIYTIYTGLNVICLLLGMAFWTVDTGSLKIHLMIATAGVMFLLLIQGKNSSAQFLTMPAYLFFFWGISYLGFKEWYWILLQGVVLLIILNWLKAPATFLSGLLYGFWLLSFLFALVDFFGPSKVSIYEQMYSIDTIYLIRFSYEWVLVLYLIAYIVSVLPYYIEKKGSNTPEFHFVTGLPLYLITLPVQTVSGVSISIYKAIRNYIEAFRQHVRTQSLREAEKNEQPAFQNYWFRKAFADIKSTFNTTIYKNKLAKQNYKRNASELQRVYGYTLGAFSSSVMKIASLCVWIFGYIILVIFSLIHLMVAGIVLLPIYCYYLLFAVSDRLYLQKNKVATVCPSCYHKSELPDYICGHCEREHTDLRPSIFGIRIRKCLCGNQLPATSFNQRYELQAKCKNPKCKSDLLAKEFTPLCISIIGGPSSGKTSFVLSAVRELKEKVIPNRAWNMEFLESTEEEIFQRQTDALKSGLFPNKSVETKPFAFNFTLSSKKWTKSKLLYLYDAAGEVYRSSQELAGHKYYSYLDGYVLIVDPFAMPDLLTRYQQEINDKHLSSAKPSETLLEDTYDLLLVHLAKNLGLKQNEKVSVPLAIVINKVDVMELEKKITAIQGLEENQKSKSENERLNEQCQEFLKGLGHNRFVKLLESKFTNVQFFLSTSAPSTESLGEKSSKPITWIMEQKGYS